MPDARVREVVSRRCPAYRARRFSGTDAPAPPTVSGDPFRRLATNTARDPVGDIPIAGDEPSDLSSGGLVVGVADAILHRQLVGLVRPVPALHPANGRDEAGKGA
jgi:hypothetical protein